MHLLVFRYDNRGAIDLTSRLRALLTPDAPHILLPIIKPNKVWVLPLRFDTEIYIIIEEKT